MRFNTFFYTFSLALLLAVNLPAQTVRVIFVSGHAELQRPDEAAAHAVVKGESVIIGTRISTGADGRVVLTPMPGVKSMIAPNTIIVLESASDTQTSPTEVKHQAVIDLKVGSVVSDLNKQPGATFDYSIRTPRGLAGARGTTFSVELNPAGIQTIVVSHGTITLSLADGRTVSLTMGQASITQPDGGTEHSGKASELSPADQALVEASMTATLEALTNAVEQGVELQGDALANALATAESLGIPIPDELKQRVQTLIDHPPVKTLTDPDPTTEPPLPPSDVINPTDPLAPPSYLTSEQADVFKTLSDAAKSAIINLNDPDITTVALSPDTDTGLTLADSDIVLHLTALLNLKNSDPDAYALFKTLAGENPMAPASVPRGANGGTTLPYIDNAPDPAQWSLAAFERALAMWNLTGEGSLTSLQKQQIVSLGAGEIVMDRSVGYISAILDAFYSLSGTDQGNLQNAGWGKYLSDIANNPTNFGLTSALSTISGYDPGQITLLNDFGISPKELLLTDNKGYSVGELLTALNNTNLISGTDLTTLRQLGAKNSLLDAYVQYDSSGASFASFLTNSITFYNSLTAEQQQAVRAIGAGNILLYHSPDDYVGSGPNETPIYISDRITELANYYLSLQKVDQQALRDMGLFNDGYYGPSSIFVFGNTLNTSLFNAAISTYKALPQLTKNYLAAEGQGYTFFQLFMNGNSPVLTDTFAATESPTSNLRSLSEINTILAALTSDEYATLLDLDASKAIFETGTLLDDKENVTDATTALKAFVAIYNNLGTPQKSTLRELGIVGDDGIAFLGADSMGLGRLLTAYSELSGTLRASTERLNEIVTDQYGNQSPLRGVHFGSSEVAQNRSYFFPYAETSTTLVNVSFEAAGDLYVGATKYLVIDGTGDINTTFTVAGGGDLVLRASNLIDLTSTTFSSGVRTITMEAATINLTNIDFPGSASAYLNSKLGGTADGSTGSGAYPHFGSSAYGRVNFIGGVKYNGNTIDSTGSFDSYGNNIHIGSFTNPLVAPPKPLTPP